MITANVGFVIFALLQLATYKIPIIVGFDFITGIMTSDALDYEQYRHGKRVEGFWQNFIAMITTLAGIFIAIVPLFIGLIILSNCSFKFFIVFFLLYFYPIFPLHFNIITNNMPKVSEH